MLKANVDPVGGRGSMTLELKGDILICHSYGWSETSTLYIPMECLSVESSKRRDGRILIRGFLAPLLVVAAIVAFIPPFLAIRGILDHLDPELLNAWYLGGALAAFMLSLLYSLYSVVRFIKPRPVIRFRVHEEEGEGTFEFWYEAIRRPEQSALIDRMKEIERQSGENLPFPLRMGYTWQHVRPARAVIVRAFGGMFLFYVLTILVHQGWQWIRDVEITVSPWFLLIFLLPWVWFLGQYLILRLGMRKELPVFREGVRFFDRQNFDEAEKRFLKTLEMNPDHIPSLYLLIDIAANRFDFDQAFHFCQQLAKAAPDEAEVVSEELWTLRRLASRIERAAEEGEEG